MKKIIAISLTMMALCIFIDKEAFAGGYLVTNATVVSVSNSANNIEAFSILTTGSTSGPCGTSSIFFYPAKAGSQGIYERAYKQAMVALVTGKKIHVWNYSGLNCDGASYIQLLN